MKSSFVPEALEWHLFELRNVSKLGIQFLEGLAAIEHIDIAVSKGLAEAQNLLRPTAKEIADNP